MQRTGKRVADTWQKLARGLGESWYRPLLPLAADWNACKRLQYFTDLPFAYAKHGVSFHRCSIWHRVCSIIHEAAFFRIQYPTSSTYWLIRIKPRKIPYCVDFIKRRRKRHKSGHQNRKPDSRHNDQDPQQCGQITERCQRVSKQLVGGIIWRHTTWNPQIFLLQIDCNFKIDKNQNSSGLISYGTVPGTHTNTSSSGGQSYSYSVTKLCN